MRSMAEGSMELEGDVRESVCHCESLLSMGLVVTLSKLYWCSASPGVCSNHNSTAAPQVVLLVM